MAHRLRHRGPDAFGLMRCGERVLIASNRLAITDPANREADMPFRTRCGSVSLVFNGEIYNHRQLRGELSTEYDFVTNCDTEVLAAAYLRWGVRMLERFDAMFSFFLYDHRDDSVLAAVDPLGQKPLYYFVSDDVLLFSSEALPLIENPHRCKTLDDSALREAVARRFIIGEETHLKELRKLPGGHLLRIRDGRLRKERYFTMPIGDQHDADVPAVARRLREALIAQVELMSKIEVPSGLLLSGGIDSSSVLYALSKSVERPRTFSIGFEPAEGRTFEASFGADEFEFSSLVAEFFGAKHSNHRISRLEYFEAFERWIDRMGEPMCFMDAPALMWLVAQASNECRVLFAGSGPDEMLDGYSHYDGLPYGVSIERRAGHEPRAVTETYFDTELRLYGVELERLIPSDSPRSAVVEKLWQSIAPYRELGLTGQQLTQLLMVHSRLMFYEYAQLDRITMASSVETRCPYAQRMMLCAMFSFAPHLKAHDDKEKFILKLAFAEHLPQRITARKKAPFPMPMQYFFSDTYEQRVEETLVPEAPLFSRGIVSLPYVRELWRSEDPNHRPVFARLYMLNRMLMAQSSLLSPAGGD